MNWAPVVVPVALVTLAFSVAQAAAQTTALALARTAELQQLSVCPVKPSVGVIGGPGAAMLITELVEQASGSLEIVERARLSAMTDELCLGPAFNPATITPSGGLLFAMYLVDVQANLEASPAPVSVRMIRVDSGAVIFDRTNALSPVSLDALDAFLQSTVPGIVSAIGANGYDCSNDFAAVIAEDVTLACGGTIPQTGTSYTVDAAITVEFTMRGFDYATRGTVQQLSGPARVLPATVRTTLRDTVTRNGPRCAFTMTNAREITIALAGSSVPATYTLMIPLNTADDWSFTPLLPATPPLFRGPATIGTTMTTVADGNCTAPGGTVSRTTNYVHQELNDITFGTHQLQPVCGAGHQIPVAFTKVPNLGTPNAADITAGCSVRSAQARFSFQRRF